jgi:hypothetical protein
MALAIVGAERRVLVEKKLAEKKLAEKRGVADEEEMGSGNHYVQSKIIRLSRTRFRREDIPSPA